jgi:hypothetical protein
MARKIIFNLEGGNDKMLTSVTEVYCTKKNKEVVDNAIKAWLNHPEMKKIHALTKERFTLTTKKCNSWFDIAHYSGDTHLIQLMKNYQADTITGKLIQNEKIIMLSFLLLGCFQLTFNTRENQSLSSIMLTVYIFIIPICIAAAFMIHRNRQQARKLTNAQILSDLNPPSLQYHYTQFDRDPTAKTHHNNNFFSNIKNQPNGVVNAYDKKLGYKTVPVISKKV